MSSAAAETQVVVLGAGVIGLTVAHVLSENARYKIKVVARDMPEDLDSQAFSSPWAGANWSPMGVHNERTHKWEKTTFNKFWDMIPSGLAIASPSKVFYEEDADLGSMWYRDLVRDAMLEPSEVPASQKRGVGFQTVSVCPDDYLPWIANSLRSRGVEFVRLRVASIGEAVALAGPNGVLVNATGLGARSLLGLEDKDVYPIRGQTMVIDNPKVREFVSIESGNISPFGSTRQPTSPSPSSVLNNHGSGDVTYIIPRPAKNGSGFTTILGGKYQEGNWDTSFSAEDARGILDRCAELVPAIKDKETKILRHNVGLRPARKGGPRVAAEWMEVPSATQWITVEADAPTVVGRVLVVHSYGFGSAGYQMSWGAAEEVGSLIYSHLNQNQE
ncbi:FAD dependent oxidoreductase [Dichomitus squalens]|nr:FAD dependent oxidoreductase [Dichomitus squalens]